MNFVGVFATKMTRLLSFTRGNLGVKRLVDRVRCNCVSLQKCRLNSFIFFFFCLIHWLLFVWYARESYFLILRILLTLKLERKSSYNIFCFSDHHFPTSRTLQIFRLGWGNLKVFWFITEICKVLFIEFCARCYVLTGDVVRSLDTYTKRLQITSTIHYTRCITSCFFVGL